ncbi:restriction endonuclease [Microvirga subterranea]|uniref:Restriction endonuclease n=1 Tax=Microvirga subterranea TaxID=186651 RepID=A0A370H729_9HYPH|nr:restriction endonuclease [Microvirga subterranea]
MTYGRIVARQPYRAPSIRGYVGLTAGTTTQQPSLHLEPISPPTPWPNANARLLGLGAGLPMDPLGRLELFSPKDFERFTLEWASDYLSKHLPGVYEVQQRGGAGDKGRDVIVWLDPPHVKSRRWHLYQCKHYSTCLGADAASAEIGKILYHTANGAYSPPVEYWFVTHKDVTSPLQDLIDNPNDLKNFILSNWDKYCSEKITSKVKINLSTQLETHIKTFDFSIFRVKQPLDLIKEHSQTRYHFTAFGAPLLERPPPPKPPSSVVLPR